jgi:hypothetical protein
MDQIAIINMRNGEIKPHGERRLSEDDLARIHGWIEERAWILANRIIGNIHRTVDYLNFTTQWVQSKATPDQLDMVTDDLRSTLLHKKG